MLLGILLCRTAKPGSRLEAAHVFRDLTMDPNALAYAQAAIYAVRSFCEEKCWAEAETVAREMASRNQLAGSS
jgi:hypothetical protein